jgi:soluble lytic murein transglycosylase
MGWLRDLPRPRHAARERRISGHAPEQTRFYFLPPFRRAVAQSRQLQIDAVVRSRLSLHLLRLICIDGSQGDPEMNRCLCSLTRFAGFFAGSLIPLAAFAFLSTDAAARPSSRKAQGAKEASHHRSAPVGRHHRGKREADKRKSTSSKKSPANDEPGTPPLSGDLAVIKDAISLARRGKTSDATDLENKIIDPAGQKLAEWFILRHRETSTNFSRYAAFISANPNWPSIALLRKRAEAALWQDRSSDPAKDAARVHQFTGNHPATAKGSFAVARVLLAEGDRDAAALLAREAWRSDELSETTETDAYQAFSDLLTPDDHRARMDRRIGARDLAGARRAAKRLGSDELAIVKACSAVRSKDDKAKDALDDVAIEARQDLGYTLCRIQWLIAQNKIDEAARVILAAAPDTMAMQDTDQWWRERRTLARKLLDQGKFQTAYDVVRPAAMPASAAYRADYHFMCGWIALRYLDNPAVARSHFADIDQGSANPIVLARANYWRGRVAEALGEKAEMEASYAAAARYPTAYYGQLARAKLGIGLGELRLPAEAADSTAVTDERVRAADMLYEIGERDVVLYFVADLAEQSSDSGILRALGELTLRHNDAHSMLGIGKPALARGLGLDHYAFPTIGIPQHSPIAPDIGRTMTYSVARTESAFDQKDKSSASAVGLMQVTPEAGRDTAKRFRVSYDWDRLVSDPVYNTQMGAAELSALVSEYRGSEIMIFAGYNAGRGRVRDWVKEHGDPRDPNVDPVDWVERIPFSETRNYVQRVMENMQVYRMRFENYPAVAAKSDEHILLRESSAAQSAQ